MRRRMGVAAIDPELIRPPDDWDLDEAPSEEDDYILVPRWQAISGLLPGVEYEMSRSERRFAIRKLFKAYEELIREFLDEHEKDAEKPERTFLWDPIAAICYELGIARRKLSALTKELTGMAAHEVVDRARAEKLKEKIEARVRGELVLKEALRSENAHGTDVETCPKKAGNLSLRTSHKTLFNPKICD